MGWAQIVLLAIPLVSNLISLAEKLITGAKQGAVKKSIVVESLASITSGMASVSGGGQKDTWVAIGQIAPLLIDPIVTGMNTVSKMTGGQDIILNDTPNTMGRTDAGA